MNQTRQTAEKRRYSSSVGLWNVKHGLGLGCLLWTWQRDFNSYKRRGICRIPQRLVASQESLLRGVSLHVVTRETGQSSVSCIHRSCDSFEETNNAITQYFPRKQQKWKPATLHARQPYPCTQLERAVGCTQHIRLGTQQPSFWPLADDAGRIKQQSRSLHILSAGGKDVNNDKNT